MEKFLPKKTEKEVISIRLPVDMLSEIDRTAAIFDLSRNEFINQCIGFALRHMGSRPEE